MPNYTYFLADPEGKIKIGRTRRVLRRCYELQKEHGTELTLIALLPSTVAEYDLHKQFAYLRTDDGEWFRPEKELLEHIEGLNGSPISMEEINQFVECVAEISSGTRNCANCMDYPVSHIVYTKFHDKEKKFPKEGVGFCSDCYTKILDSLDSIDIETINKKVSAFETIFSRKLSVHGTSEANSIPFGQQVRTMLGFHDLNQRGLSHLTGIQESVVSLICNDRTVPTPYQKSIIKKTLNWPDEDQVQIVFEILAGAGDGDEPLYD